jgi:hypothetical protein
MARGRTLIGVMLGMAAKEVGAVMIYTVMEAWKPKLKSPG